MAKAPTTRVGYRDAKNGEFITKKAFETRSPANTVKERVPLPGHGDTNR